jgi:hypothetical protein
MIRLFKVKEKQKETAENAKENGLVKKQSAGELRLHRGKYDFRMYICYDLLQCGTKLYAYMHIKFLNTRLTPTYVKARFLCLF